MSKLRSQLENLLTQRQPAGQSPQPANSYEPANPAHISHGHPHQHPLHHAVPQAMPHPSLPQGNPQFAHPQQPTMPSHPQQQPVYQQDFHGYPANTQFPPASAGARQYAQQGTQNPGHLHQPANQQHLHPQVAPQQPAPQRPAPVQYNPQSVHSGGHGVGLTGGEEKNQITTDSPLSSRMPSAPAGNAATPQKNHSPEFQNIKSSLDRLASKLQNVTQAQQAAVTQASRSENSAMLTELRREFEKINGLLRGLKQLFEAQNSGGQMNAEIQHISQTVRHLSDVQSTQPEQIVMMSNEIRSLGTQLEALIANSRSKFDLAPIQQEIHQNFAALGSRLELLAKDNRSIDALSQSIENNQSTILNRIDSLAANAQKPADEGLISQIRALEQAVAGLPRSNQMQGIHGQLQQLASAMDQLGQPDESNAIIQRNLSSIEARLDEITRGLVAISSGGNSGGSEDIQRVEARVASLAKSVEDFIASGVTQRPDVDLSQISGIPLDVRNSLAAFEDKLGAMASAQNLSSNPEHLVEIASYQNEIVEALHSLEAKIDGKPGVGQDGNDGATPITDPRWDDLVNMPDMIQQHLVSLDQKLGSIDTGKLPELDGLAAQINRLSERLDDLSAVPLQDADGTMVAVARDNEAIASKLEDLVGRIDSLQNHMGTEVQGSHDLAQQQSQIDAGFAQLEQQLEMIAAHLGGSNNGEATPLDSRLERIEQGLASSRDVAIEVAMEAAERAATQAARDATNAVAGGHQMVEGGGAGPGIDPSVFSALAEDVRMLAERADQSGAGVPQNFEGVEQALSNIVDRIGGLEQQLSTTSTTSVDAIAMLAEQSQTHLKQVRSMLESLGANNTGDNFQGQPGFGQGYQSQLEPNTYPGETVPEQHTQMMAAAEPLAMSPSMESQEPVQVAPQYPDSDPTAATDFNSLPNVPEAPAMQHHDENLAPVVDNDVPLAPGTGLPEVPPPMAPQLGVGTPLPPTGDEAGGTDFIAAARRAAQAAQMEATAAQQEMEANSKKAKAGNLLARLPDVFAKRKKVMILAAAAVLVAALAVPLSSTFLGKSDGEVVVASQSSALPDRTANVVEDPVKLDDEGNSAAETASSDGSDSVAPEIVVENAPAAVAQPQISVSEDGSAAVEVEDSGPAIMAEKTEITPEKEITKAPMPAEETGNIELRQAAANGDEVALFEIGRRYTDGIGVSRNLEEASKWYELSASRGYGPAQYRLGNFYEKGHGVKRDIQKAAEWYVKAADSGNALAMHNLAVINATGVLGDKPDMKTAVDWFTRAADLGVKDSQVNLGILYTRGMGVDQNTVEAYKWFSIASKAGDSDASAKRDTVANAMRPDQLEQARAEVALWKPKELNEEANTVSIPDSWKNKNAESVGFTARQLIQTAQSLLTKHGFDPGPADGLMGAKTRNAIMAFQQRSGMTVDGNLTQEVISKLKQDTI